MLGVGTKSASNTMRKSPLAVFMPCSSAPALKPCRSSRRMCDDVEAARLQLGDLAGHDLGGLVDGVVEHLQLELVLRVVEGGDAIEQPLGDVAAR